METGTLKLEVGKRYRTRDGRVSPLITKIRKSDGVAYFAERFDGQICCHPNGRISFNSSDKCGGDLVAPVSRATPQPDLTGPVRTVTRKEIVPGVYGHIWVDYVDMDVVVLGMRNNALKKLPSVGLSAGELRDAIATLTQIADALEDQA